MAGPLAGVRILDLTRVLAGPFATQMLGAFGAEVIKVESAAGDPTRQWGPPFTEKGGESAYFLSVNANKKSVVLDLKSAAGKEQLLRLACASDVLVHNFKPGTMARLGFSSEALQEANPSLIRLGISGYGDTGPDAHRPGYDVAAAAEGGLLSITGEADGPPVKVGVAMTDICTGLSAVGAIASALYAREIDPRRAGQEISCSLLETQVACLANVAGNYLVAGQEGRRWGTEHESIVPYGAFDAADGAVVIAATTDEQFAALCAALGREDLLGDGRFGSNALRVANRAALLPQLRETVASFRVEALRDALGAAGLVFAPVRSVSEVFSDAQVRHRGMVQTVSHPTAGELRVVGVPVKFSRTPARVRSAPPLLGQHTEEVLGGVGRRGA